MSDNYLPEESTIRLFLAIVINLVRLVLFPIFALVLAVPLFFAWNYVMPDFGLPELTYLKTICLMLVVSWLMPTHYHPLLYPRGGK